MNWTDLRGDRSAAGDSTVVESARGAAVTRPVGRLLRSGSAASSADRSLFSALARAYTLLSAEILVAGVVRAFPAVRAPRPLRAP